MCAEKNAARLEAPRDHGPFAREVDPFLARIACQKSGQRESERNGETRVAGIKIRWMNDHFRILQERVQSVAIHADERLNRAGGGNVAEHFEWAGNEIIQREEKDLYSG